MSGISAIYFLDKKGRPIIFRNYRGEVTQDISSNFQKKVLELEESNMKPLFSINDVHYCWIRYKNIYIVAVSKRNPDICMVFFFLHRLIDLLIGYFNVLEDESIRDNFVLIYELLDEIMDHGYPQNTDAKLLKEYIKTSSFRLAVKKKITTEVINNQVSRAPGIKYQVNQAFVDVTERVSSLISHKGEMLRSDIIGVITMKTMLSGMPVLKLGLNEKSYFDITGKKASGKTIEMDDFKFHNCVDINKFEAERVIEFIPPDGFFTLMNYRLNLKIKPLIWVEVERKELTPTKMKYLVKAKSNCKPKSTANNVCIMIPVPVDLQNPLFKSSLGSVTYSPDKEVLIWSIKRFPGMKETNLIIQFNVPSLRANDTKGNYLKKPIEVKFEIPSFTVSGIQVRYLKITEASGYQAYPYVKYVTKNGEYQIRMD
jgi:AP-1 complex subunit mu